MTLRRPNCATWTAGLVLLALGLPTLSMAADGDSLYKTTCVACHGPTGQGAIPGVPDLASRLAKTDAELAANILNGFQSPGSAMAMPAKGGNPNLTAADAQALVVYLRTLTATPSPPPDTLGASASPRTTAPPPALPPVPAGATPAGPDMAAFGRGAQAWADTCARCHAMRDPKSETDPQWQIVVTHMRLRAGLDGEQARDIVTFLQGSN